MTETTELRKTFTREVERYHQYRPLYPLALFDYLSETCGLTPQSYLLEIGPGTGQATLPLAEKGYAITAVELGPQMANKARKVLAQFPTVKVVTGAFEDVELPLKHYDLVYSATAFHWIDPIVRFAKPHRILRDKGYLAIIHTHHVSDEQGDAFFYDTNPIYRTFMTADAPNKFDHPSLPLASSLQPLPFDALLFKQVGFMVFPFTQSYTTTEYIGLLRTYSPHIAMPKHKREAFLEAMTALINTKYNGRVAKHYAAAVTIAQAVPTLPVL